MFSPYENCGYDWEEAPITRLAGAFFRMAKNVSIKVKNFFKERAEQRRLEKERVRARMLKIIKDLLKHRYLAVHCHLCAYKGEKFRNKMDNLRCLELMNPGQRFWFSPTSQLTFSERHAIAAFGRQEWADVKRTLDMLAPQSAVRRDKDNA